MKLEEIDLGGKIVGLWKGQGGTGKSIALASFPEPIYVLDLDGRMKSVAAFYNRLGKKRDINFDTYNRGDFSKFQSKMEAIQRDPKKYATYSLDSLTNLADLTIDYCISSRGNGKKIGEIELPGFEEFGGEDRVLGQIIAIAKYVGQYAHFIVTAHVVATKEVVDAGTGVKVVSRTLTTAGNKIAAKIPTKFDEVWHFQKESSMDPTKPPTYVVYTNKAGVDDAKTALPLPAKIEFSGKELFPILQMEVEKKGIKLS